MEKESSKEIHEVTQAPLAKDIYLSPMTRELCRKYYKGFECDPDIYMDMSVFKKFQYSEEWADAYFDRQLEKKRIFLAIMHNGLPIGEVVLKDIDSVCNECTLGIHMQNDSVKGRGLGTQAEKLALEYAFSDLNMVAVNADTVIKNLRSQHVLEKVGFHFVRQSDEFKYYRALREDMLNTLRQCTP